MKILIQNDATKLLVRGRVDKLAEGVARHQCGKALNTLNLWICVSALSQNYTSEIQIIKL